MSNLLRKAGCLLCLALACLVSVFQVTFAQGKIVVANDEWTLSNQGVGLSIFSKMPQAGG